MLAQRPLNKRCEWHSMVKSSILSEGNWPSFLSEGKCCTATTQHTGTEAAFLGIIIRRQQLWLNTAEFTLAFSHSRITISNRALLLKKILPSRYYCSFICTAYHGIERNMFMIIFRRGWMISHFLIVQVHFVFCSLNFVALFFISYKIMPCYVYYYCIFIGSD